jgi:hypothetical protein
MRLISFWSTDSARIEVIEQPGRPRLYTARIAWTESELAVAIENIRGQGVARAIARKLAKLTEPPTTPAGVAALGAVWRQAVTHAA